MSRAYFGDGFDGAAVFDGIAVPVGATRADATHYSLQQDVYYTNITIAAGVNVDVNGGRIFWTGTFTLTGHLHADGFPGQVSAATPAGGAARVPHVLGGSGAGGVGGIGGGVAGGSVVNGLGGNGSVGTVGNISGAGAGGTVTNPTVNSIVTIPRSNIEALLGQVVAGGPPPALVQIQGGGGGGGGGQSSSGTFGGGGGGGGVVVASGRILTGAGNITANGGAPGVGTATSGGGGGGGFVVLVVEDATGWTGTLQATATGGGIAGRTVQVPG